MREPETPATEPGTLPRMLRPVLDPPVPAADPTIRRRSRLLAAFLLIMIVVFGAVDVTGLLAVPGYSPPWYGYAFLAAAWVLNRRGRYTAASGVVLAMFPAVILGQILVGSSNRSPQQLSYLVLGVLLASILLRARGTALFAVGCAATVLLAPLLAPSTVSLRAITIPLALVTVAAGLAIVSILHRDRLERDRQAEREELIRELEAKNAELERFTYTVSHDLKSPLVTIRGFLGLIDRDVAEGRTDRLRADVERMKSAADSMGHLLHELLRLSRVGRVVNAAERVSLGEVVREAASLLRARLDERRVRLEVDPDLPEVYGDRVRLVEVVQNLLENAVKFLGDQATPVVRIGARPGDGSSAPVLFVRDNGVGIDPRFHEKVFGLFEKLDPRAEGSGVGLALVKRIVEVHGGSVWIESAGDGQGTAVCFTLPPPPPGR